MEKNNCLFIGKIAKKLGYKGALIIHSNNVFPDEFFEMESAFVELDGGLVPFFFSEDVEIIQHTQNSVIVVFDNLDEQTRTEMIGSKVFIPSSSGQADSSSLNLIENMEVYNEDGTLIGVFNQIIELPGHSLLQVFDTNNKEILIPSDESILKEVNQEEKKIIVKLPEGLLDL